MLAPLNEIVIVSLLFYVGAKLFGLEWKRKKSD